MSSMEYAVCEKMVGADDVARWVVSGVPFGLSEDAERMVESLRRQWPGRTYEVVEREVEEWVLPLNAS